MFSFSITVVQFTRALHLHISRAVRVVLGQCTLSSYSGFQIFLDESSNPRNLSDFLARSFAPAEEAVRGLRDQNSRKVLDRNPRNADTISC